MNNYENRILPALRSVIDNTIDTPNIYSVYDYMILQGLSKRTANNILNRGFILHTKEIEAAEAILLEQSMQEQKIANDARWARIVARRAELIASEEGWT